MWAKYSEEWERPRPDGAKLILKFLVPFFVEALVHGFLMPESPKPGIAYTVMVLAVSFLFSMKMYEIVVNVIGNFGFALAALISDTTALSVGLTYDWDRNLGNETS